MCFSITIHEPWCLAPNTAPHACDCTKLVKDVCLLPNAQVKTSANCGTYTGLVRYNKCTFLETSGNSWVPIPAFDWNAACPEEVISDVQLQHRQKILAVMNLKGIVEANKAMIVVGGKVELVEQMEVLMKVQKRFWQPAPIRENRAHRVHRDRDAQLWRLLKEIFGR